MKINKVDNKSDKTSFRWTIPLKNAEKKCGLDTYRFSTEMNGLGKYDVYIKPLKTKTTRERESGCWGPILYPCILFVSAMAGLGGTTYMLNNYLPSLTGGITQIVGGIIGGLVVAVSSLNAIMFKKYNDFSVQAATQRANEKDEDGNPMPAGIITKEYKVKNSENRYRPPVDFVREIQQLKEERFKDFIKHYDTNDLFDAKNYARVLQNRPRELDGADFFNYKIDEKGNTLTTAFFDVVPNDKEYPHIIKYLQRQHDLDFNQRDGNGISCIEKVLISENTEALNLILNSKYTSEFGKPYCWYFDNPDAFPDDEGHRTLHNPSKITYSPELDDIYPNLQDKKFKKMVDDNIQWDFTNWIDVIKSHDVSKAEKLKKRFNSPLLNKKQLFADINDALSTCKDMNFITYMQTNFLKELMGTNNKS